MNNSIRSRLLKTLLAGFLITSLITCIASYYYAAEEIQELYRENMKQLAAALPLSNVGVDKDEMETSTRTKLDGEEEFLVQVWTLDGMLLYSSHPNISFPFHHKLGFGFSSFQDEKWEFFVNGRNSMLIQIAQPTGEREEAILEVVQSVLVPLLVQIPFLCLLIWIVINRSLSPLVNLSSAVKSRDPHALEPIVVENLPQELNSIVASINNLLERLNTLLQAQRRFIADAAHELRTPLTAVQLQLDVLRRSVLESEREEALSKLSGGVKRCIHLIRQLLVMAKNEPATLRVPMVKLDLVELTKNVIDQFKDQALTKNISLEYSGEATATVLGAEDELRVMIENIIDNAVRYSAANVSGALKVKVVIMQTQSNVSLNVLDSGIGIDVDERERVFDRFYRVAGTQVSGSGLGLAIVKQVCLHHSANVFLHNGLNNSGLGVLVEFPKVD